MVHPRLIQSPLSVAPMMDRTDRFYRRMMRLITKRTLLYTEMVTTGAILHGDRDMHLALNPVEGPIALQLGGSEPKELAECARIAEDYGYDEVNINVGCPSDRVQNGCFGAVLMKDAARVAASVDAMRKATSLPITVKHRIGVDEHDSYEFMRDFVATVLDAGAARVTAHARIALLKGLNPKQNRTVPPLRYEDVYRLKEEFPQAVVELNGGVKTLEEVDEHLRHVDAVMIGRAAYDLPMLFATADSRYFDQADPGLSPTEVVMECLEYARTQPILQERPMLMLRHLHGLMAGQPGARAWRRALTVNRRGITAEEIYAQVNRTLEARAEAT